MILFEEKNFISPVLKIMMKHIQTTKNPYQPMDFKNLEKKTREQKVSRLLPNVCDFQKENHTIRYVFKNL
jgi:hypothetical protein